MASIIYYINCAELLHVVKHPAAKGSHVDIKTIKLVEATLEIKVMQYFDGPADQLKKRLQITRFAIYEAFRGL
jgi:hypothetical protein